MKINVTYVDNVDSHRKRKEKVNRKVEIVNGWYL